MTPPSRPAPPAPEIADRADNATADAVVWSGEHAVIVGSAGAIEPTPKRADPIAVDGARYHGWIQAASARGVDWARRFEDGREVHVRAAALIGEDVVLAGEQRAGDLRAYTGWVARIAPGGVERWRVDRLGEPGVTGLQAIAVRSDGSVVAGGMQAGKAWLVALDEHGKRRWDHELAGVDEVTAAMRLGDAIVVAGVAGRTTTSAGTSRLIALDAGGAARWTTALPERGPGELFALAPLGDGGVAVGQAPRAAGDGAGDGAWIVRFGPDGAVRSSEVLAGSGGEAARAVAASGDGGFLAAGSSFDAPRGRRAVVWRFDAAARQVWRQTYGGGDSSASGVAATPDGGAVVVGSIQAPGARLRAWIAGLDRLGAERWTAP